MAGLHARRTAGSVAAAASPRRHVTSEGADRDRAEQPRTRAQGDEDAGRQQREEGQEQRAHPLSRRSFSVMSARRTR